MKRFLITTGVVVAAAIGGAAPAMASPAAPVTASTVGFSGPVYAQQALYAATTNGGGLLKKFTTPQAFIQMQVLKNYPDAAWRLMDSRRVGNTTHVTYHSITTNRTFTLVVRDAPQSGTSDHLITGARFF